MLWMLNMNQLKTRELTAAECFEKSTEAPTFLETIGTGDDT